MTWQSAETMNQSNIYYIQIRPWTRAFWRYLLLKARVSLDKFWLGELQVAPLKVAGRELCFGLKKWTLACVCSLGSGVQLFCPMSRVETSLSSSQKAALGAWNGKRFSGQLAWLTENSFESGKWLAIWYSPIMRFSPGLFNLGWRKNHPLGLPWWLSGKESACHGRRHGFISLIWEDPTHRGGTKPMDHNDWVRAPEPGSRNCWSPRAPEREPALCNKRSHRSQKSVRREEEEHLLATTRGRPVQ